MDGAAALVLMLSTMAVMVTCHQVFFIGSEYNPQAGIPPRWFLPYNDPCTCTAVRLGGMRIPASSYRQRELHYLDGLFLSEDADEIGAYFNCTAAVQSTECLSPQPLGMEDGTIQDARITASRGLGNWPPHNARLNRPGGGWAPFSSLGSWVEVDLVESTVLLGVITQGYSYRYVTRYTVAYQKQHSSTYEHVTDGNGNIKEFVGNTDGNTPVTNLFDVSVVAKVVRIKTTTWVGGVVLRLELLGCRLD